MFNYTIVPPSFHAVAGFHFHSHSVGGVGHIRNILCVDRYTVARITPVGGREEWERREIQVFPSYICMLGGGLGTGQHQN